MTKATAWYTTREVLARFLILLACTMAVYGVKKHKELKAGVTTINTTETIERKVYVTASPKDLINLGPVTVSRVWHRDDAGKVASGGYQLDAANNVVMTLSFCDTDTYPVFTEGEKFETITYSHDEAHSCEHFYNAQRSK